MRQLDQKVRLFYDSKTLLWGIIAFGVMLRLIQYLSNRSIWMDEAFIALNVIDRSFIDLFQPLAYDQSAPVGFMTFEKLGVELFGNSEYALRLFPLFCGMISLFLFYRIATHFVESKAIPIALALCAFSYGLISYSSSVKPYSSDVAIALVLYVLAVNLQSKSLTGKRIALYGIVGAIAVWFSNPAVFVLAGTGTTLLLFWIYDKEWTKISRFLLICATWIVSFGFLYFLVLKNLTQNQHLVKYFNRSFIPFPPTSLYDILWPCKVFLRVFKYTIKFFLPGLAVFTFLIGCILMFAEKRKDLILLFSPIPFALIACGLRRYPLEPRLLLFFAPIVLLVMAEGIAGILRFIGKSLDTTSYKPSISITISIILIALLIFDPLAVTSSRMINSKLPEIRPVINYIKKHWHETDFLYIYYAAEHAFQYYSRALPFKKENYVVGLRSEDDWHKYAKDVDFLRGRERVWVLFSHNSRKSGIDEEEKFFLYYLNTLGTEIQSFRTPGAAAYLYDLKQ